MIAQSANLAAALGALGLVLAVGAVVRGAGDILLQDRVAAYADDIVGFRTFVMDSLCSADVLGGIFFA